MLNITTCMPEVKVGNPEENANRIIEAIKYEATGITIFPQLSLTGVTAGDLIFTERMKQDCQKAIKKINDSLKKEESDMTVIFGAPVYYINNIYDCVVVCSSGKNPIAIAGNIDLKRKFSEIASYFLLNEDGSVADISHGTPIFVDKTSKARFAFLVNDDLSVPYRVVEATWSHQCDVIIGVSTLPKTVGSEARMKNRVKTVSDLYYCGYLQISSGEGECSASNVYSSMIIAAQNGEVAVKRPNNGCRSMDIAFDIDVIRAERKHCIFNNRLSDYYEEKKDRIEEYEVVGSKKNDGFHRVKKYSLYPFLKNMDIKEVLSIMEDGLYTRMKNIGVKKLVIGVSGGLDSTLALLVAYRVYKAHGWDLKDIIGITMPCFGTSERTKGNARMLRELGITIREIDIAMSILNHFEAIGHSGEPDIAYENAQARERTQVLMDVANMENALVLGTGNMSEAAVGWCTYNGDHISMYNPNGGVPKTVIRFVVKEMATNPDLYNLPDIGNVLKDIVNTPISPELLPLNGDGEQEQKTEENVGNYVINDFILYYYLRYGFSVGKIFDILIENPDFRDLNMTKEKVKENFKNFYRRFSVSQFKRNCATDGAAVWNISLNPRTGWIMPSDIGPSVFEKELEELDYR